MSELSTYIKTVIVIILLKPVVKGILPSESMSKYINFVMGLMIITLLVIPFSKTGVKTIENFAFDYPEYNYEQVYKKAIEESIEDNLNEKFGTNDVDVILDDNYNIIDVSSVEQKKIKEYLGI